MPEFGEDVDAIVEGFTALERSNWEAMNAQGNPTKRRREMRQRLIVQTVKDENGVPLFTPKDYDAIAKLPAPLVERLVDAALRVCGMSDEEPDLVDQAGN